MDLKIQNIEMTIGSIPHRVAFANLEEVTEESDRMVPLPDKLQESIPKLPGVIKTQTHAPIKGDLTRTVPYFEYSAKEPEKKAEPKKKGKKKKAKK